MEKIKIVLATLLLVIGIASINAQDKNNPYSIGFGVNAIDFYPTNPGLIGHGSWFEEFVNTDDHYNIIPSISKVTVSRYLTDGFSIEAAGSLNKIKKVGDNSVSSTSYLALDGAVKYDLNNAFGQTGWFDPYASIGGGYIWMGDHDTGTFNGALGFNVWFNDNLGLNLETKYKHAFESKIVQHFQHSLGLVIKFGGTDSDNDGVFDDVDACPEVFGLIEYNGCPDSDNDGVIDSKDACPNVAGPAANNGCPWPDTDNDGVLDKDDDCPKVAGLASNKGCPEVSVQDIAKLEELFKTVYFETNKASFKSETIAKLNEAIAIIVKYPTAKFAISGHTDSIGNDAYNLKLSEERAQAVKNYLISKGVSSNNLTAKGYGETQPVESNMYNAGRAANRRVDIKLID